MPSQHNVITKVVVLCGLLDPIDPIRRLLTGCSTGECRCDERLKPKDEESTYLGYTGLLGELEYLKIETRLIDEKFSSVMGKCVI